MAITTVVNTDEIVVLGPPASIDLQVDIGQIPSSAARFAGFPDRDFFFTF